MEKPKNSRYREGPQKHHRHRDGRDQGGPDVPHEQPHDQEDQKDGLEEGLHHLVDGHLDEGGGVVGVDDLHPRGEVAAHLRHLGLDRIGRFQGIRARRLPDGHAGGGPAVVKGLDIVGVGSQLRASHILDADDGAVRIDADGNGGELFGGLQHALHDDGGVQALPAHCRRPAELAGRDLHVVGLERRENVLDRQAVIGQPVGVQPEAHGILGAEVLHLAHAGHPGQHLLQVGLGIVPEVVAVHAAVFRDQAHDDQVVPGRLTDRDPLALDHLGQAGHGELQLVLHLGPGEVRIGPRGEGQLEASASGRIAGGGQVDHLVEAGHLLLDDLGDAVLHGLRRGAGIEGLDVDRWGGDGRVLRDGQIVDGEAAHQHDDDGNHPGEDRAIQEEFREHEWPPSISLWWPVVQSSRPPHSPSRRH